MFSWNCDLFVTMVSWTAFLFLSMAIQIYNVGYVEGMDLCRFSQIVQNVPVVTEAEIRNSHTSTKAERRERPTSVEEVVRTSTDAEFTTSQTDDEVERRASTKAEFITRHASTDVLSEEKHSPSLLLANDVAGETSGTSTAISMVVSTTSSLEPLCPPNMVYVDCTCQHTCADPNVCFNNCTGATSCICPDGFSISGNDCIHTADCGCFWEGIGVISEGETYINVDCSMKCSCNNDQLDCNADYKCSSNAICGVKDQIGQCTCNDGYEGDGETCRKIFTDCYDVYETGNTPDGVHTILPANWNGSSFNVSCDMMTSGGGWTVFQRRIDGLTDFYQPWDAYKEGFGSLLGDFWLGNEKLHHLTNQKDYRLRVDIVTADGTALYSEYSSFRIDNEVNNYQIVNIGARSGNAGDGMASTIGRPFSTYDNDHACSAYSCSQYHRGAWWYANDWCHDSFFLTYCALFWKDEYGPTSCAHANLNGDFMGGDEYGENIFWDIPGTSKFCFLTSTEMKIRPNN